MNVQIEVAGEKALFSDPLISAGGEKLSLEIPTYQALVGVLKSIYWKPTFLWVIDRVRIMNPIQMEAIGTKLPKYGGENSDLAYYTYLKNVRYQVEAHIEWNFNRPEFIEDRSAKKHYEIFQRRLESGGTYPVFLGKKECMADVYPMPFGTGQGHYDHSRLVDFGMCYHGITYADEAYDDATKGAISIRLAKIVMQDGIIVFPPPKDCFHKILHRSKMKIFHEKEKKEISSKQETPKKRNRRRRYRVIK